ncbi:MAG: FtsX-like permease family protein [Peptostreptococcaceae bacterium]
MINTTKIAKNNLKQNKSKRILVIATIMIATTLLSAVGMTCADWSLANKKMTIKYAGTQHGVYADINKDEYEEIKSNVDIESVGVVNTIGYKEYKDKTQIGLLYVDENAKKFNFNNINLIEGKFPTKKDEIVLDDLALEKLGYEKKLGQKIKLDYQDVIKRGVTSAQFILTGITKANDMSKTTKSYSGLISEAYMESTRDMSKEIFNVFVAMKGANNLNGYELMQKVENVGNNLGVPKDDILVNEDYINTFKPDKEVIMWGSALGLIVILSAVLVIYNIFHLSVISRVQEFGKLRAIGTTKKQIKSIVLKEGVILSLTAIPLGVLLGYVINKFVISRMFFQGSDAPKLSIIIGVIIISLVTVFVSLLKPMKVASKVSIVDAIRYNGEKYSNKKSRKGYKNINLKRLAYANLSRNKKSTYVTILSLTMSGIIFIVMSSVMNSIDAEKLARLNSPYDMKLNLYGYTWGYEDSPDTEINILQMKNPLNKEFLNKILKIDGVNKIEEFNTSKVELKNYETESKYQALSSVDENYLDYLQSYLQSGKIDLEKLKLGKEIIIQDSELAKDANIKVGDNITLKIYDGDRKIDKEFKVQAIVNSDGDFLMHNEAFDKLFETDTIKMIGLYVNPDKYEDVKSYIEAIDKSDDLLKATFIDDDIAVAELSINMIKAIGYSLVIIIGVIGFINLINSMITSIITRKKEIGMLQAIGLTDKQLMKMLNIEAMYYTGTMLISSLIIGNGLGYIAVQIFRNLGGSYAIYTFPILQVMIMVICIVVAQLVLNYLIIKNLNKESLIDRVRYSE